MFTIAPIGYIHSCFKEKFATPRQPLLAPAAKGVIELLPPYNQPSALEGLEQISHIWLLFVFHKTKEATPRIKVRPPRLGGNKTLGVFATRSTFRPNNLGQSVVKLDQIKSGKLYVSGIDLVDKTPIIDIKPYIPYADSIIEAYNHIAPIAPIHLSITWEEQALKHAKQHAHRLQQPLVELIEQCLRQDPRPAYQSIDTNRYYGVQLWDVNLQWHYIDEQTLHVLNVMAI